MKQHHHFPYIFLYSAFKLSSMITEESRPPSSCEISSGHFWDLPFSWDLTGYLHLALSHSDYSLIPRVPAWCPARARDAKSYVTRCPFSCCKCRGATALPIILHVSFLSNVLGLNHPPLHPEFLEFSMNQVFLLCAFVMVALLVQETPESRDCSFSSLHHSPLKQTLHSTLNGFNWWFQWLNFL